MPTRSYYFPKDLAHIEKILTVEGEGGPYVAGQGFSESDIPPLPSVGSIAALIGISPKILYSIRFRRSKYYRSFRIKKKKKGEYRFIYSPRTYLKVVQWWILDSILSRVKISDNAFGFVRGKSSVSNAICHIGANHLLNVDIKEFFPSILEESVTRAFVSLGYSNEVSEHLAAICTLDGRLPQGAPSSPAIANIVCRAMDNELSDLAAGRGLTYTRYADDLTFSSKSFIGNDLLSKVQEITVRHGFVLNGDKTRFAGRGDQMEVTGVVINVRAQPPLRWRKRARATLHNIRNKSRLIRSDIDYLRGILGVAGTFEDSPQLNALEDSARSLLAARSAEVVGIGTNPILPNGLTQLQAEVLATLRAASSNADIAATLKITESAVKKRLQLAFRKLGLADRQQARIWAEKNL